MAKKHSKKKTSKKTATKRKTAKRPTRRAVRTVAPRRRVKIAPKGYAYVVKLGDDYQTTDGDYASRQAFARRFHTHPTAGQMAKVIGDSRRPRVVKLHLRSH